MSLISDIKKDQLLARKTGDKFKATLLTTLLGDAQKIGKDDGNRETTDQEVVKVVKKFVKGLDEFISLGRDTEETHKEKDILSKYLPQQITGNALYGILINIKEEYSFSGKQDMGKFMKVIKDKYPDQVDGKEASTVVKEIL